VELYNWVGERRPVGVSCVCVFIAARTPSDEEERTSKKTNPEMDDLDSCAYDVGIGQT